MKFPPKDRPASERRGVPAKKFVNPKKGSTRDRANIPDRSRTYICVYFIESSKCHQSINFNDFHKLNN